MGSSRAKGGGSSTLQPALLGHAVEVGRLGELLLERRRHLGRPRLRPVDGELVGDLRLDLLDRSSSCAAFLSTSLMM